MGGTAAETCWLDSAVEQRLCVLGQQQQWQQQQQTSSVSSENIVTDTNSNKRVGLRPYWCYCHHAASTAVESARVTCG